MKKGDFVWGCVLVLVSLIFIIPSSREVFVGVTQNHPYMMAFLKFFVLATMGELLAIRMAGGEWKKPSFFILRAIIWGMIGVLVTLMFTVFGIGVRGAIESGMLIGASGAFGTFLTAFLISVVMNFAFAPVFMIAHRMSDTWIDLKYSTGGKVRFTQILETIDWTNLIGFVVVKSIPFFWIPAHTITFLIPGEFRVLFAAYLSIALGIILVTAKKKARS